MSDIKIGTIVQLRSGGPEMTVTGMGETGTLDCTYFWEGKFEWKSFKPEAVNVIEYGHKK